MKLLITGGNGQLGWEFTQLPLTDFEITALSHTEFDINNASQIKKQLAIHQPNIVINTAAYTAVDKAEQEIDLAFKINRDGAHLLAQACAAQHLPLIHLSTDYVFDGKQHRPYKETDPTTPLNIYGASKLAGEIDVRKYCDQHIILRVSGVFGMHGNNFVKTILRTAQEKEALRIVADQTICPTPATAIAETIITICKKIITENNLWGTYHYCSDEPTNWHQFAEAIIALTEKYKSLTVKKLIPIPSAEYKSPARRPAYSVLDCNKLQKNFGITPCSWQLGLTEVIDKIFHGKGL